MKFEQLCAALGLPWYFKLVLAITSGHWIRFPFCTATEEMQQLGIHASLQMQAFNTAG